ncbi:DUF4019 domain-containing protein [Aurantiacibacter sp. MUD11]|uniref:helix-turn-helix domain-containing protein n=1 Tax=Aurantiacibacter sp. MUD11 TaxID=3003265 RepID=UPI0022AA116C|nr:DUF4019 domain-containing protein [Aurantiacibacter sp. MUD11]WAT19375.1 DUF4019 domain-containing protein [Aurantiacibacter sp. MUD11]
MQQGLAELTDKEKEALRLLLGGHDAKSSAAELGLSVHTINDRLRSARRKLGVGSSREAARILGDAEGSTPQIHAPKQLGMGAGGTDEQLSGQSKQRRAILRRIGWLAGGIAVIALITAATMMVFTPASEEPSQEVAAEIASADSRSEQAALAWLAMADAGEWEASWEAAGTMFRGEVTAAQWAEAATSVRDPLGAVTSREVATIQRMDNLPGAPAGDYEVVQFSTAFENAPSATETVIMAEEESGLKVVGYFIR